MPHAESEFRSFAHMPTLLVKTAQFSYVTASFSRTRLRLFRVIKLVKMHGGQAYVRAFFPEETHFHDRVSLPLSLTTSYVWLLASSLFYWPNSFHTLRYSSPLHRSQVRLCQIMEQQAGLPSCLVRRHVWQPHSDA